MFTRLILIIALLVLPATSLRADLLVYEGFDYGAPGNVAGQSGGIGWSSGSAWETDGTSMVLASPGLAYSGFVTVGNTARDDVASSSGSREIYRDWDSSGYTNKDDTLWFSFFFSTSSDSAGAELRVHALSSGTYHGAGAMMFTSAGQGELHARLWNTQSPDSLLYDYDDTHWVVGRVNFTDDDWAETVTVWLNPDPDAEPGSGGVTVTKNTSAAAWTNFYIRGGSTWLGDVDELRIGTSFLDVVPVPEPGSALLAVCGAIGLLFMRRRRAFVENA